MTKTLEQLGLDELSPDERLELIGLLWDSITDAGPPAPVPEEHKRILKARLDAADADPDAAVPWERVKKRLVERG